jgi:hypothetical protein
VLQASFARRGEDAHPYAMRMGGWAPSSEKGGGGPTVPLTYAVISVADDDLRPLTLPLQTSPPNPFHPPDISPPPSPNLAPLTCATISAAESDLSSPSLPVSQKAQP